MMGGEASGSLQPGFKCLATNAKMLGYTCILCICYLESLPYSWLGVEETPNHLQTLAEAARHHAQSVEQVQ